MLPSKLTQETFSNLARVVSQRLSQLGVPVPSKGHYCHILEATARGLGFASKSAMDVTIRRGSQELPLPSTLNENAARQWLIKTGLPEPIPATFLSAPFEELFLISNVSNRTSTMSSAKKSPTAVIRFTPNTLAQATSDIVSQYANRVWDTADTLRGVGAKASEWPIHMMPFFATMLLESRALRARKQALATFGGNFDPTDSGDVADLKGAYASAGGASSQTYHEDLVIHGQGLAHVVSGGPSGFSQRLRNYLNGYDDVTRRLLGVNPGASGKAYLNIEGSVRYLEAKGGDHLWHYCKAWSEVDLVGYDSSAVTTLEEHIKRKWADISADTAGEHYTPADLIELIAALAVSHFTRHPLQGRFLRIYDPTCGGGNMLFGVEDKLRVADAAGLLVNASGERYSIQSFGQELNDTLFSLAAIEGRFRPSADIREGNTLSDDKFPREKFDLIVANPPYGTDWKQIQKEIEADQTGRFPASCRPPVSDGQQLFLQHIQHHLADEGLAMVFCSGSTLFSGDAGGGESNARMKYTLTDDGVYGIIQLPKNEFFNTGINTYVWMFLKCKPDSMSRKMFLLNAESLFSKMRKSLGNKNSEITERNRLTLVSLVEQLGDPDFNSALMEEGSAMTVDIANRLATTFSGPNVAGVGDNEGKPVVQINASNEGAWNKMDAIHLKVIKVKEGTPEEPALLRLFDSEQLHYNKVSIDIVRAGENGAIAKPIEIPKAEIQLGSLSVVSGAPVEAVMTSLPTHFGPSLPPGEVVNLDKALKSVFRAGAPLTFHEGKGCIYSWDSEARELSANGDPVGRANVDFKTKVTKGKNGQPDTVSFTVTAVQDVEKDTETTPFRRDAALNEAEITAFLGRWVADRYTRTGVVVGCEINFNRLFPKTGVRKTLSEVNQAITDLDLAIARIHQEGV